MKVLIFAIEKISEQERASQESFAKVLRPYQQKALISHVLEKCSDKDTFFVVTDNMSSQIQDYLSVAHPDCQFSYLNSSTKEIKDWLTRLPKEEKILLVSADFIIHSDVASSPSNWIGVCGNSLACALQLDVLQLLWVLDNRPNITLDISLEETAQAIKDQFKTEQILMAATNVSSEESLHNMNSLEAAYDFGKPDEQLYIFNNRVVKFFEDSRVAQCRVEKSRLVSNIFPEIERHQNSFFSYKYQPGLTLYRDSSLERFKQLIHWLENNLWRDISNGHVNIQDICKKFYYDKTLHRVQQFNKKYSNFNIQIVNSKRIRPLPELFKIFPWKDVFAGHPSFIHGDLQPDNIIFDKEKNKFCLIDWRQDFGGEISYGDIYYDFAKLWAGINVNYDSIKQSKFSYLESENSCEIFYEGHEHKEEVMHYLENFIADRGFSVARVRLLAALIYINMSALHKNPFDKMLYVLGQQLLETILSEEKL
ncbi:aminoglycoside phosphotransferase family protein [Pseudobdellovibrio exovorus]|uniref:Aminoglycoside phosphotransferase domain-containing protein n=1 Tax=Pseudobdellovibrio exovorus JSS TaxID=1184267 RepID=M4VDK1_9BACT|nr:phosphotransferase [Pseudobdellovibrio exovorus]AGH96555.1 hypothetical protein A11Q_2339 [Pseudobdellovibrio exovorus JSS]